MRKLWSRFRQWNHHRKPINWRATIYFNLKKFPFADAIKFPVVFYGGVSLSDINGDVILEGPISRGMIGIGQPYESRRSVPGKSEICIQGTIRFKGNCQIGPGSFIHISTGAECIMGNMSSLGYSGKIICQEKIVLGDYARLGFESQIIDTSVHQMIDVVSLQKLPMTAPVLIGDYNYIGNRVTFLKGSATGARVTVGAGSICVKDYRPLGENVMIAGNPAGLVKSNISRDWEGEMEMLEKWLRS